MPMNTDHQALTIGLLWFVCLFVRNRGDIILCAQQQKRKLGQSPIKK